MREKLRLAILNAYGIDIDKYEFEFKTSLNAYTINIENFVIRVTTASDIPKEIRLERLKWAKELKSFKNTICEPVPSKNHELLEEIHLGNWTLSLSMHRTAKGELMTPDKITPMFLICVGDMLGTMHKMSMERDSREVIYEIPNPEVMYEKKRKRVENLIPPEVRGHLGMFIRKASTIEKTHENYGVCYGEYDLHNIIVDTNNIHLFDFDNSIYSHYLYDVASFAVSILSAGYLPNRASKDVIFNHFIPWFRIGYSINKPCDSHTFDDLPLYMSLRGIWLLVSLLEKYQQDQLPELKVQIDSLIEILMCDDIFKGIDTVRNRLFNS